MKLGFGNCKAESVGAPQPPTTVLTDSPSAGPVPNALSVDHPVLPLCPSSQGGSVGFPVLHGSQGSERLNDLPKVTRLMGAGFKLRPSVVKAHCVPPGPIHSIPAHLVSSS